MGSPKTVVMKVNASSLVEIRLLTANKGRDRDSRPFSRLDRWLRKCVVS
jgi:hypothetical protein